MSNTKEIHVLIVEDDALASKLVKEYFGKGITFVQVCDEANRNDIADAISRAEDGTLHDNCP